MNTPRDYLGRQLRSLRKLKGVTGKELADRIGYSQSGISKLEQGVLRPHPDIIRQICIALGASSKDTRRLVEQTHFFLDEYSKWSVRALGSIAESQKIIEARESRATAYRAYSMHVVNGLLQTREYMQTLFSQALHVHDESKLAQAVSARTRRQNVLKQIDKEFHFVLDERTLTPTYCDQDVMRRQIEWLLTFTECSHIGVQILPANTRLFTCPVTSFVIFDGALVNVEALGHELTIWTEPDIQIYLQTFQVIQSSALSEKETTQFLLDYLRRTSTTKTYL
jgi:transcriptional regulator with XRE-family HTH domain